MNTSFLVSTILNGVLGARTKRSRRAGRYLTGGLGGLLTNPTALMTAAGLAWGVYDTLQKSAGAGAQAGATTSGGNAAGGAAAPVPPPVATTTPAPSAAPAVSTSVPSAASTAASELTPSTRRLLRLAISAATADGAMNAKERAAIAQQATAAGVPESMLAELTTPGPLAEIVAGVDSAQDAATLYVLAFTILRADEQVTTVERIYLAQLAHLLHLDQATVQALEHNAGERIDALGDQGQPGG
jgi:uncharacterized membrane protein YebE (DUF533 family)